LSASAPASGLGTVRLLPDVLGKTEEHVLAVVRDWEGQTASVDPDAVWGHAPPQEVAYPWPVIKGDDKVADEELKRRDAWQKIFMPQGAILAGRADDRHWLTFGAREHVPVLFTGDAVLMPSGAVQTAVRLGALVPAPAAPKPAEPEKKEPAAKSAQGDTKDCDSKDEKAPPKPRAGWAPLPEGHEMRLRMSGLLWPEAAERLASAAYLTRESVGRGQVILFASSPTFRAGSLGTARLFTNAMVYGPGLGASHPIRP
jgi:hypothetical protein